MQAQLSEQAWQQSLNCHRLCMVGAAASRHRCTKSVGSPHILRMLRAFLVPATLEEWLDALVPRLPILPWSAREVSKGHGWTRMRAVVKQNVPGGAPEQLPQRFIVEQTEKAYFPYARVSLVRSLAVLSLTGAARGRTRGVATVYGIWQDDHSFYSATEDVASAARVAWTSPALGLRGQEVSQEAWRDITRQLLQVLATLHAEGFSQCARLGASLKLLERIRISQENEVKLVEVQVALGDEESFQKESYAAGSALLRLITGSWPLVLAQPGVQDRADLSQHQASLPDPERRQCQDLLERLMAPSPRHRLSIEDALRHPWCN